jgi:hypothetical protein
MVKLLVTRMKVITIVLTTVGKNLNGVGQLREPLRKKPYATRHVAKVAASAIRKSHIANFLLGMANGDDLSGTERCVPIVKSDWLTTPPARASSDSRP